ncbi:MAG: hypothetical protein ABFC84_11755 [Veillonellales bacterium]
MDIATYTKRESMLRLRENLLVSEESRLQGTPEHSIDEVSAMMKVAVHEVLDVDTSIRGPIDINTNGIFGDK